MVSIYVLPSLSATIEADGVVRLSDGRTFDLSAVAGNGFNANRLGRINAAIQAQIDKRQLLSSLPLDDPDRTINPNRVNLYWSDADGNPSPTGTYLCARHTLVWLTYENGVLVPHCTEVR